MSTRKTITERFWERVEVQPLDNCWSWHGAHFRSGYGSIRMDGHIHQAHRISWRLHNGDIPVGLWVLHKCRERGCVNPSHLYLGTPKDNCNDRDRDGTTATGKRNGRSTRPEMTQRGERSGRAKLSWQQVCAIRGAYAAGGHSHSSLSKAYHMHISTIGHILTRRIWKAAR